MKVLNIHHIAIICSDYESSKKFYVEKLGFKIVQETYRAERRSYKLDIAVTENINIELFSFPITPDRPSQPEACGCRHFALQVDDIDEIVRELETKQIVCEPIRLDTITNKRYTFFADPDGLPIELYES